MIKYAGLAAAISLWAVPGAASAQDGDRIERKPLALGTKIETYRS
jgi:hypothetical protein